MKKSNTLLFVGGAAVALYLYSKSQASTGQGGQGRGQLPSQGGYYSNANYTYGQGSYSGTTLAAARPRFRR